MIVATKKKKKKDNGVSREVGVDKWSDFKFKLQKEWMELMTKRMWGLRWRKALGWLQRLWLLSVA